MKTNATITEFRSDIKLFTAFFGKLCLFMAIMLFAAVVIGQLRADRFPVYFDLVVAPLLSIPVFLFLVLITHAAASYFKIGISADKIRCYNALGRYESVSWPEISMAKIEILCGAPYVLVYGRELSRPLTLPVWLENPDRFIAYVENWAGTDHPLTRTLKELKRGN